MRSRNLDLNLTIHVSAQSRTHVDLKMRILNNADVDYFIQAYALKPSISRIKIVGPSEIYCYIDTAHYLPDKNYLKPVKIEAKGSVQFKDLLLSKPCRFEEGLPGTYTIKYARNFYIHTNESLAYGTHKPVYLTGETTFELE